MTGFRMDSVDPDILFRAIQEAFWSRNYQCEPPVTIPVLKNVLFMRIHRLGPTEWHGFVATQDYLHVKIIEKHSMDTLGIYRTSDPGFPDNMVDMLEEHVVKETGT
jgi:hypothetical protein